MNYKEVYIVVDAQNDFVTGSLAVPGAAEVVPKIRDYINNVINKSLYVSDNYIVFTRDTHERSYLNTLEGKKIPVEHCIKDTPGWCIVDELAGIAADNHIVDKSTFGKSWFAYFNDKTFYISSFDICGFCSDICVVSNALMLRSQYPETPIRVHKDLCAGTSPQMHEAAMEIMQKCCIDVV